MVTKTINGITDVREKAQLYELTVRPSYVHLQVLKGDIATEKTEAVAVFRSNVDSAVNGDSQR